MWAFGRANVRYFSYSKAMLEIGQDEVVAKQVLYCYLIKRTHAKYMHNALSPKRESDLGLSVDIVGYTHPEGKSAFLQGLHFRIAPNGLHFLTGPSGAGKSTITKIILGNAPGKFEGSIAYCGSEGVCTIKALMASGLIGYFTPTNCLLPWLKVRENLNIPARLNPKLRVPTEAEVSHALRTVNLSEEILEQYPHELSYGMYARVGLMRTVLYPSTLLILDELFNGLDNANNQLISNFLEEEAKRTAIFFISHDVHTAMSIADHIHVLTNAQSLISFRRGQVSTEELLNLVNPVE